jgi:type VI secretion system protein ImpM
MSDTAGGAAWYGKLPSLGDFASRRLGADFIDLWDAWLASGLAAWRASDEHWLQAYLAGPSWRFLLATDALRPGSPALAGVLMPSVDKVGRYFPLTLVQPLNHLPEGAGATQALLVWLHRLDDLAVDAMQADWPIAQLEAELAQLGLPASDGEPAHLPSWAQPLAQASALRPPGKAVGSSWWWCLDAAGQPRLFTGFGLPRQQAFLTLVAGRLDELALTATFHALN